MIVVVIDDEPQIVRALRAGLRPQGFEVVAAATAAEGLEAAATHEPAVVVVDLGLPDLDGTEVVRRIRGWSDVPIIVLSARDDAHVKIEALDAGADDYVNKPFAMGELSARIRASLRRAIRDPVPPRVRFDDFEFDVAAMRLSRDGKLVHLTPLELGLLRELVTHPGALLTHRFLLERVWGSGYGRESHYLRVFVRQLRRKLGDDAARPRYILTEPGMGYRWIEAATKD